MKVSIIVPIYNFTTELYGLTKVALATLKADEHILVDNGSSIGEIKDWADIYVKNRVNLGFPKAMNQGFKLASGEIIEEEVFLEIKKNPKTKNKTKKNDQRKNFFDKRVLKRLLKGLFIVEIIFTDSS